MLELTVSTADSYVAGFPMLASVTLANVSRETTFQHLPEPDLLDDEPGLDLFDEQGRPLVLAGHARAEGAPTGRVLGPGERFVFTVDLAGQWDPSVGEYQVQARWPGQPDTRTQLLVFRVTEASDDARQSSARIRSGQPWAWWVLDEANPIEPEDLAALGLWLRHLDMHRFVRIAVHGDTPIAGLDVGLLVAIEGPSELEASLFRHEILSARGDAMASGLAAAITERWPGCEERLAENACGDGWLTQLRVTHGPTG